MSFRKTGLMITIMGIVIVGCQSQKNVIEESEPDAPVIKFGADDPEDYAYFGSCVAVNDDGSVIVTGANGDDESAPAAGAVYVLRWDGSNMTQTKITASDSARNDHFGESVAISSNGNVIAVGSPDDDDNGEGSGSLYVFQWSGSDWKEKKIIASDGEEMDRFGECVSISGDGQTVVVGAPRVDDNGISSGAVYVYRKSGISWLETKITALGGKRDDNFGQDTAVSHSGNRIIVGTPGDDIIGKDAGSLYVYDFVGDSWEENQILRDVDSTNDRFGESVAITADGLTVIAGAPGSDMYSVNGGKVCLFEYKWNDWSEIDLGEVDGLTAEAKLGCSVGVSANGKRIVAGSELAVTDHDGKIFIWNRTGFNWQMMSVTESPDSVGTKFGLIIAISGDGNLAVIGNAGDMVDWIAQAGTVQLIRLGD